MEQHTGLMYDIMNEHNDRMRNLKKYFPFFKLQESSLNLFKEGKYEYIDMGYVTLAVLRFLIEENSMNESGVTYSHFAYFVTDLLALDFDLKLSDEDNKELIDYIFDKLRNDGKPFYMEYFDPAEKKKKTARMKLIDSKIEQDIVTYHITPDAIEFYLDTKEMKDESKINIQQLLLEKMIQSRNFTGGIDVIKRINHEVNKLRFRKQEVLSLLAVNVFEGVKSLREFTDTGMRWFDEEQRLFSKNKELIEKAFQKAEEETLPGGDQIRYQKITKDIYLLETELKKAIHKHSELLADCMELQIRADEIIQKSKLSRFRSSFDFKSYVERVNELDNVSLLEHLVMPLTGMNLHKTLNLSSLNDLLTYKTGPEEIKEQVKAYKEENYRFIDDVEDERIQGNFSAICRTLLNTLLINDSFDLKYFNEILNLKFFSGIFKNSDYYSFLVHLCQKKEYDMDTLMLKQDTFLEGILVEMLQEQKEEKYKGLKFRVKFTEELSDEQEAEANDLNDTINIDEDRFITSNIQFERVY